MPATTEKAHHGFPQNYDSWNCKKMPLGAGHHYAHCRGVKHYGECTRGLLPSSAAYSLYESEMTQEGS